MLVHVNNKATAEDIQKAAEDLDGYIKFVVDLEKQEVIIGGLRHFQAEEMFIKMGSKQENLWGGGYDPEAGMLDFDSMINIRPRQNTSREVLDPELRKKIELLLKEKVGWNT